MSSYRNWPVYRQAREEGPAGETCLEVSIDDGATWLVAAKGFQAVVDFIVARDLQGMLLDEKFHYYTSSKDFIGGTGRQLEEIAPASSESLMEIAKQLKRLVDYLERDKGFMGAR